MLLFLSRRGSEGKRLTRGREASTLEALHTEMTVNYVSSNPVTSLVRGAKKEKKKKTRK